MIYDYETVKRILDGFNGTKIVEEEPLAITKVGLLPIRHFTYGSGSNHIVVTGSWHSNEVITTTFVIELMNHLIEKNINFDNITIHFIPILNPDGYLINTSAITAKVNLKDNNTSLVSSFCYDYYTRYRYDTQNPEEKVKLHQEMFRDITAKSISNNSYLREAVGEILKSHPKGSIIDWSANGRGIDLNSNTPNKQVSTGECNRNPAINNIRIDMPSPIGHPGNNSNSNFVEEIEISSLRSLFDKINEKGDTLLAYLNYHSVGGLIYQRPISDEPFISTYNYLLSKYYQEFTIKNRGKYDILTKKEPKITSVNDGFRVTYPGNLLIELSPMSGNPIGVFGDINNYDNTINGNIKSFIYLVSNIDSIYSVAKSEATNNSSIDYPYLDSVYARRRKKD